MPFYIFVTLHYIYLCDIMWHYAMLTYIMLCYILFYCVDYKTKYVDSIQTEYQFQSSPYCTTSWKENLDFDSSKISATKISILYYLSMIINGEEKLAFDHLPLSEASWSCETPESSWQYPHSSWTHPPCHEWPAASTDRTDRHNTEVNEKTKS